MESKDKDKEMRGKEVPVFQLYEQDSQCPYLTYVSCVLKGSLKKRKHKACTGHFHCLYQPFSSICLYPVD